MFDCPFFWKLGFYRTPSFFRPLTTTQIRQHRWQPPFWTGRRWAVGFKEVLSRDFSFFSRPITNAEPKFYIDPDLQDRWMINVRSNLILRCTIVGPACLFEMTFKEALSQDYGISRRCSPPKWRRRTVTWPWPVRWMEDWRLSRWGE